MGRVKIENCMADIMVSRGRALKISLMCMLLFNFIAIIPKTASASPIVDVEATVTYVAPVYSYSYTVKNLDTSTENVWTFSLYFPIPVFDIVAPTGWNFDTDFS
ncbi:MAG: hypothetical protein NZ937_10010, partial [Armatimonadetes bacterium]|nr:hypothetical protein [Armatimonadota bacterium]